LSFTQSIRELHDAQLFTGGSQNDPDIAGANPTVYTKLWLQIKSKLLAGETGVCRVVVFFGCRNSRSHWGVSGTLFIAAAAKTTATSSHISRADGKL
jgi:hypothetical protein